MVAIRQDTPPRPSPVGGKGIAPFPWFGGKQQLVPTLLSLMPPHEVYVEVFGGDASLLCSKIPAKLEVYNDLDSGLVNFFRVLRHKRQSQELIEQLRLTPYAREEWKDCRSHIDQATDPVEYARRWYVSIAQSFSGDITANSWRHNTSTKAGSMVPNIFQNGVENLAFFAGRFACVQVEHDDFSRIIRAYDDTDVFFYCDPPYMASTRRRGGYRKEMTPEDHIRLLDAVTSCKGMVLLSGYDHPLYEERLDGWLAIHQTVNSSAAGRTRATGLQGKKLNPATH